QEQFTLVKSPLFRFSSEGTVFGSVYVWQDQSNRLAVVGTVGSIPMNGLDTEFIELHLLKAKPIEPVTIAGFPTKRWDPGVNDLAPQLIPDAPPVAGEESARFRQMRMLARSFSSTMHHENQNNQLRLLPRPLYRYANTTRMRDGALFAFVWDTGTDPELLLRIETVEDDHGEVNWHYQPVRFTWRELTLNHDDKQVWRADEFVARDRPAQTTPYLTGLTRVIPDQEPVEESAE
ncbi:MAG: hypothetical protein MI861_03245, partial [Pirellulales bacterium]|nr:hypothetical protein [Pirellulales bacterium]